MQPKNISMAFAFVLTGLSQVAMADWPTDPSSPLFVGPINNGFDERAGTRSGGDGSVWFAWQEAYCQGDLLLQRVGIDGELLAPMGLNIQSDPTCGFHLEPLMGVIGDSVVVARNHAWLVDSPVQRFSDSGSPLWGDGFAGDEPLSVQALLPLENGDVLIASIKSGTIYIDRLDGAGNPVWAQQLTFPSPTGANFDLVDLVPDAAGGAYLFWESPATYVRFMYAMRISANGETVWDDALRLVDVIPPARGTSRHTHSEMVSDGQGGAIVVYSEGFEQGVSPAAMYMQRVFPDGSMAFAKPGVRVSMDDDRQFDVDLERDPVSGDVLITWRDGFFDGQSVRAQRMTIEGDRLWGDQGVEIAPLATTTGSFDSVWVGGTLKTAVGAPGEIVLVQTSSAGSVDPSPLLVGTVGPASFVKAAASGAGVVLSWQVDGPELDDLLVAQRVNRLGVLGGPPTCLADLTGDGQLDFFDVSAFLAAFATHDPMVDFTGDGLWDFFDVSVFLSAYSAGCP